MGSRTQLVATEHTHTHTHKHTFVHIQSESPDGNAHHVLAVLEELDGFGVEGEVSQVLVVEEVNGVLVEVEGEGLEEGDVISEHFLLREVQLQDDDGIDVVV